MNLPVKRPLGVAFIDHCHGDPYLIVAALSLHYQVRIDSASPDLVFVGDEHGREYRRHPQALKVLLQHENRYPDFANHHYGLGYRELDHPRWFRQPLYVRTTRVDELIKAPDFVERQLARKTRFCGMVVSNANRIRVWRRLALAEALDRAKPMDFGGGYRNNVGGRVPDKQAFFAHYRFALVTENDGMLGYTTEQITDAMRAGCIPIYWGSANIETEFNPKSFINARNFESPQALVARVMEIENSPELYRQYLAEPYFHGNRPSAEFDPAPLGAFLHKAIESPRPPLYPVYPQYRWYDWTRKLGFVADWAAGKLGAAAWRS